MKYLVSASAFAGTTSPPTIMTPGTPTPARVLTRVAEGLVQRSAWRKSMDLTMMLQLASEGTSLRTTRRSRCLVMPTSRSGWQSILPSMAEHFKTGMLWDMYLFPHPPTHLKGKCFDTHTHTHAFDEGIGTAVKNSLEIIIFWLEVYFVVLDCIYLLVCLCVCGTCATCNSCIAQMRLVSLVMFKFNLFIIIYTGKD